MRQHPDLLERWRRLTCLRREIDAHVVRAQREYQRRCAELYRTDPVVCDMRRQLANMRQRARRWERRIEQELAACET